MHEVVFLNEERVFPKRFDECDGNTSIWFLDNGASNHMTCKRVFFSKLDESVRGKVKFGEGSNVEIYWEKFDHVHWKNKREKSTQRYLLHPKS